MPPNRIKSPLLKRLPKDGADVQAARELVALGYPEVTPVLPHLFQWLNTSGSAVELVLRPFFAGLGAPARDLACTALEEGRRPALKYCLLRHVLPYWPRDVVLTLERQIEPLLHHWDYHGLDIWAHKLMVAKRIPAHQDHGEWKAFKIARLQQQLAYLMREDGPDAGAAAARA